MAKYLGGIEDSNIEIVGISQHFFSSGFDIQYYNYQLDTLAVQKLDIAKSLVKVDMPGKAGHAKETPSPEWVTALPAAAKTRCVM